MKPGTQIAYIPNHADGDVNHPDVEFGFVTSENEHSYFCRYWEKGKPGQLRTVANSEATPKEMVVEVQSVPQDLVDNFISALPCPVCEGTKGWFLGGDEAWQICPACGGTGKVSFPGEVK